MSEDREYTIISTSNQSAVVEEIELGIGSTDTTRRVLRAQIVRNAENADNSVRAAIVHQRRANKDASWEDLGGPALSSLRAGEAAKISLDTTQTRALFEHLRHLYQIGDRGISAGTQVLVLADENEVIRTEAARARIIKKLLEADHGAEFWAILAEGMPELADKLATAQIYEQRKAIVAEFETNIDLELGEEYWQKLLANNRWIFGNSYIGRVGERRLNIKSELDHPLIAEDGCLEIVEIKKPETPFWVIRSGQTLLYRDKYPIANLELQGAIAQAAGYIFEAEKAVDSLDWHKLHDGIRPIKPRALVVHGRSIGWTEVEQEAFRLLNDRHHGITIITFDHLLQRAKQLVECFDPRNESDIAK
jgi:hypothetical protein